MTVKPAPASPASSASPVAVEPSGHPIHALTTYQLSRYRRELEHALKALPQHVAVRELLSGKLAEVLAEQEGRRGGR
jgi:hypothetical protein